jgi:hypothetical protein
LTNVHRQRLAVVSVVATAAVLIGTAVVASSTGSPSHVVLMLALAFVPYSGIAIWEGDRRTLMFLTLGSAAAAGVAMVAAPSILSDDLFRYLWDARVLGAGADPYAHAPDDVTVAGLRDGLWERVNHRDVPTIYPPVAQGLFAFANVVDHAPWTVKAVALVAHLLTIPVVARLASDRAARAVPLFGLNPLCLSEAALGGHVDSVVALSIAACVLCLVARRGGWAAVLCAIASGTKLVGLLLGPLVVRLNRRAGVLAIVASVLLAVPLVTAGYGSETPSGLAHYTHRWRGNEGPFLVVEAASRSAVDALSWVTSSPSGRVPTSSSSSPPMLHRC